MRFSVVILDLVPPVKHVSPVTEGKADRYLRCLFISINSGAGASH